MWCSYFFTTKIYTDVRYYIFTAWFLLHNIFSGNIHIWMKTIKTLLRFEDEYVTVIQHNVDQMIQLSAVINCYT